MKEFDPSMLSISVLHLITVIHLINRTYYIELIFHYSHNHFNYIILTNFSSNIWKNFSINAKYY